MATTLGELLVREGRITVEQLETALRAQVIYGGKLGTNLVEMGAIDLDELARVLAIQFNVPAALQKHFDAIQPSAIQLVPAKLAEKHGAIPLGPPNKSPKMLAVAFMNPRSVAAIDEIAFATGMRIMPTVAPELRILYQLEKHYGIQRKPRYIRLSGKDEDLQHGGNVQLAVETDRPIDLPKVAAQKIQAAAAQVRLPAERRTPMPTMPAAQPKPVRAPEPAPPPPPPQPVQRGRPALSLSEAMERIGSASSRDQVGDALIDFLRSAFEVGIVLIVREQMALGWKGFGRGLDDAVIESVVAPLSSPSMLKLAYERRTAFRGAPPATGADLQARFYKLLRSAPPQEAIVAPVLIKDRVVNLVYAHAPGGGILPDAAMGEVATVCSGAATAFVRLIQSAKGKS